MGRPLVSIIVRTKDRPVFLKRALRSIASQTYRPLEVVIVNDGGEEVPLEEVREILGDIRLNYIKLQENRGRAPAANIGVSGATGQYIGFLDDDDEIYPEHVETIMNALEGAEYQVAYTDTEMLIQRYDPERSEYMTVDRRVFSVDFSREMLLITNFIPFNSVIFRKDLWDEIGGFDETLCMYEDWDFLIRSAQRYPFHHIKKITARYYQWSRQEQINWADEDMVKRETMKIIRRYWHLIPPEFVKEVVNSRWALLSEKEYLLGEINRLERERGYFREVIAHKDREILQLQSEIRERDGLIYSLQQRIGTLESEINTITETLGWKLLVRYRVLRERVLPPGTRRRGLYDLLIKAIRVLLTEGFTSFIKKGRRKLADFIASLRIDLKKGIDILRQRGFSTFIRYLFLYLFHGRRYFRKPVALSEAKDALYQQWIEENERYDPDEVKREIEGFQYRPKISILVPVYNVEARWLNQCIESVKGQYYPNWELCLYDDGSESEETLQCLRQWQDRDSRIRVSFGTQNRGISYASNQALSMCTGDFVALLDHDDKLAPHALFEVVKLLNREPETDLIYSDEDRIEETPEGEKRFEVFFKPDWSPHLMFSYMYIGHLTVYRRQLLEELGGFRSEFDYSQDYDLALRAMEKTSQIRHIPKVLYHWRVISGSAAAGEKPFARETNLQALRDAVKRRGYDAEVMEYPCSNRVRFNLRRYPGVSIIIPTDNSQCIFNCLDRILQKTLYPDYEIIVVTNSQLAREIERRYSGQQNVRCLRFDREFNFSLKCNEGAEASSGEFLLFLNDDVEVMDGGWLEEMVQVFEKGNVGGVSPKLFYENDTIQYAGMVTGVRGLVGTAFHCYPKDSCAYFNLIQAERNVMLLSGACMMVPRKVFFEVGGFDCKNVPIMHSDVDFCFRLIERGYELIYTPFVSLRHIGHLSLRQKGLKRDKSDVYILKRWGDYLSHDPFFPENMKFLVYEEGRGHYHLQAGRQQERFLNARDILLVSHDLSLSGAPILLFQLARYLRQRSYFVMVLSPFEGDLLDRYRAEEIPVMVDSTILDEPPFEAKRVIGNFDLVLINTVFMWPMVFTAKEIGLPVIWMVHESRAGQQMVERDKRIQGAFSMADEIVFPCRATLSLYERFSRDENFRIIPYGTMPVEFEDRDRRSGDDRFVILHVGSIEPRKGQDILLDALRRLPDDVQEKTEVYFIGRRLDNSEGRVFYDRFQKRISGMKNIRFVGEVPHERIVDYLQMADLFVCSSRDEVFPVTIMEAMSAGRPIVSTDVGGISEMIRDAEEGFLVPVEDADAIADRILYLYKNREERDKLGRKARERFYKEFTIERFGERMLSVVRERIGESEVGETHN